MVMKKPSKTTTTVRTRTRLTDNEEKVVRMRKGMSAPDDMVLERKTTDPELLAKLRDIEAKLFLDAGQVAPMSKKQRIIDSLKKRT